MDTELDQRQQRPGGAESNDHLPLLVGFATDNPGWFDGHQDQHPGHYQRRTVPGAPDRLIASDGLPVWP